MRWLRLLSGMCGLVFLSGLGGPYGKFQLTLYFGSVVMGVSRVWVVFSEHKCLQMLCTLHFYQHYPHILLPKLGNKMRCTVDPHFGTSLTHFATGVWVTKSVSSVVLSNSL